MSLLRANAENFIPTGVMNAPPEAVAAAVNNNNWRRNTSLQRNANTISRLFLTKRLASMNKMANKQRTINNARQLLANINSARQNQAVNLAIEEAVNQNTANRRNQAMNMAIAEAVAQNSSNRKTRKNRRASRKTRKGRRSNRR